MYKTSEEGPKNSWLIHMTVVKYEKRRKQSKWREGKYKTRRTRKERERTHKGVHKRQRVSSSASFSFLDSVRTFTSIRVFLFSRFLPQAWAVCGGRDSVCGVGRGWVTMNQGESRWVSVYVVTVRLLVLSVVCRTWYLAAPRCHRSPARRVLTTFHAPPSPAPLLTPCMATNSDMLVTPSFFPEEKKESYTISDFRIICKLWK